MGDASRTIAIVDDNPRILSAISRLVNRTGFVATPFATLRAALDELGGATVPPAAGIIDIYLERGHQGFELSELLRERYGATMPLMMITGYTPGTLPPPYFSPPDTNDASSYLDAERIPVCEKPVDTARLQPFLVRAAAVARLRRSPAALREGVVSYALQRQLTPQEARILAHLAAGSTRSSLPSDLGISSDTVKSQIRTLLQKCESSTSDELLAALLKHISRAEPS